MSEMQAPPEDLCIGCMQPLERLESGELPTFCSYCGWDTRTDSNNVLHLRPRTLLQECYYIGRVLGQGGFGITYLGRDLDLARNVAIKEYFPQSITTRAPGNPTVILTTSRAQTDFQHGLESFMREGQALAGFQNHPAIISVLNLIRANGTAYLVMPYLEGMDLSDYLVQQGGRLPYSEALRIMLPVLSGLHYAHSMGLLHRDITPENVYVSNDGGIKILDFGAARYAMGSRTTNMTVMLKPGYAPEEQYRQRGELGTWSDVYGAAATMYRVIVGTPPPDALERLAGDTMQTPRELGFDIPPNVDNALRAALAVRSADRIRTIPEFEAALRNGGAMRGPVPIPQTVVEPPRYAPTEKVISATPTPPPPPPPQYPAAPFPQRPISGPPVQPARVRPRSGSWAVGLMVLSLLGATFGVLYFRNQKTPDVPPAVPEKVVPPSGAGPAKPEGQSKLDPEKPLAGHVPAKKLDDVYVPPKTAAHVPAPVITGFYANSDRIKQGEQAQLSWAVSGDASGVFLSPGGSVPKNSTGWAVRPEASTDYTLTAKGPSGTVTKVLRVEVLPNPVAPEIVRFGADNSQAAGVLLSWETRGEITELSLVPGDIKLSPSQTSQTVFPREPSVYVLTAHGPGGTIAKYLQVTPRVSAPVPTPRRETPATDNVQTVSLVNGPNVEIPAFPGGLMRVNVLYEAKAPANQPFCIELYFLYPNGTPLKYQPDHRFWNQRSALQWFKTTAHLDVPIVDLKMRPGQARYDLAVRATLYSGACEASNKRLLGNSKNTAFYFNSK